MRKLFQFVILGVPLVALSTVAAKATWAVEASSRAAAMHSITTEEVKKYVDALADDTFEGREAGSRGGRAAASYLVQNLKRFGFRGAGPKGSFFQDFREFHNILTAVEGRDPELKDQVVVISAHYDHVGYGSASNSFGPIGSIHNGADDNASGVAALMEVAEALSRLAEPTRRSILIAFWDGEEKGLLGSEHWASHPTVPLDRISIMVNADMVGRLRNQRVEVFGTRTSPGLRRLVSSQNDLSQLLLDFNWQLKPDSDHHTFLMRNVPIVMLHTGLHRDYHRPSDDADKINAEGLKQVAQLLFGVLVKVAEDPRVGGFRRQSRQESRSDQEQREVGLPAPPGRLGIRWNEDVAAKTGDIVVSTVSTGTAAERAGFRRGDQILSFADRGVRGAEAFRLTVLSAPASTTATVRRPGEDDPLKLKLELPGEAVRLGISWRTDEAEPGTVIVNRVTTGSPAGLAGLRVNDRIYRVNGQDFADADGLRRLVMASDGAVTLDVESHGRVRSVEIPAVDTEIARLQAEVPNRGTDDASK